MQDAAAAMRIRIPGTGAPISVPPTAGVVGPAGGGEPTTNLLLFPRKPPCQINILKLTATAHVSLETGTSVQSC